MAVKASAHSELADNEQRIKDEKERKEATEAAENKRKEKLKKIEDERRAVSTVLRRQVFRLILKHLTIVTIKKACG